MRQARPFRDRIDAGRQLADQLGQYAGRSDVIVLGLPRGGVPENFAAVGLWFEDFAATTDDEVRRWLDRFASDRRGERSSA